LSIVQKKVAGNNALAIFGLLYGATCWGVIWYPYRIMAEAGVSGVASSFYTYMLAVLFAGLYFSKYFTKTWRGLFSLPKSIFWLAFVAGWTNLSYVLAVIDGEVMRVMLLFYLSPLWTLVLARFWLKEAISMIGFVSIVVALIGAYIMLAGPFGNVEAYLPVPRNISEWLALLAGIGFSISNVITRRSSHLNLIEKSFSVWTGVVTIALLYAVFLNFIGSTHHFPMPSFFNMTNWLVMSFIALLLISTTMFVQYGITQLTAIRASVLFLFELIVAVVAAYYLANEVMGLNDWIGGSLIVAAALISSLNHQDG
jgi:drug/metabolite transporter (DMT)-like permease